MSRKERDVLLHDLDQITHGVPFTASRTCHLLFDLGIKFAAPQMVEISCGYGKATVYLAAAAKTRGGLLRCVDLEHPTWRGRTAADLLREAGLLDVCEVTLGCDARWYLLELFSQQPLCWIDLAYVDASHTVEVDAFVALSVWTHLRPDGLLVFDDLDWIPQLHGPSHQIFSRPSTSHVRVLYDYISRLPGVRDKAEWGGAEVGWAWGFIQKEGPSARADISLQELLARGLNPTRET